MPEDVDGVAEVVNGAEFAVGSRVRVRVRPGTDVNGTVVEDFGEEVGVPVDVGDIRIVDAARRWAIVVDDGGLIFADSHHLSAE